MPHENINLAKPFGKGDARFFCAWEGGGESEGRYVKKVRWFKNYRQK